MKLSRLGTILRCNFIREVGPNCRRFYAVAKRSSIENICLCGSVELLKKKNNLVSCKL